MLTNDWRRTPDEAMALCNALVWSDCGLGLTPDERLVLIIRILTEGGTPAPRRIVCALGRMSRDTLSEITTSLVSKGLLESEAAPGKVTGYRSTMPADVMAAIVKATQDKWAAENPASTGPGATPDPAPTGPGRNDPAFSGPGNPAPTGPGIGDPAPTRPGRGAANPPHPAPTRPGQAAPGPHRAGSERAHITTRAHTRARALHDGGLSLEGKKVEERVVVEDRGPGELFALEDLHNGPRINGSKIVWTDPNGAPQELPFRIVDGIIPEGSRGGRPVADVREWARAEIDIAVAEGKDGNLARWLRAGAPKSWPRFLAMRKADRPEGTLEKFAPPKPRRSDKLEPWEG